MITKSGNRIYVYGDIGNDFLAESATTYAQDFIRLLNEVGDGAPVDVHINSSGGNLWDGLAITHALLARKGVTTYCDGVALSCASVIFMAGEKRVMPANSMLMMHPCWGGASGNAAELEQKAAEYRKHDELMAGIYSRSGQTKEQCMELMLKTTYLNGNQALDLGFCTECIEAIDLAAKCTGLDLTRLTGIPKALQHAAEPHNQGNTVNPPNAALGADGQPNPQAGNNTPDPQPQPQAGTPQGQGQAAAPGNQQGGLDSPSAAAILAAIGSLGDRIARLETQPQRAHAPLPHGGVQDLGSPLINAYRALKPGGDRRAFTIANFDALRAALRQASPQAANTIPSTLYPNIATDALVVIMRNKLAMLNSFTTDFRLDVMKPLVPIVVTKSTVGPTVQTNATDFRTGDSTLAPITITPARLSATVSLTDAQINNGIQLFSEFELAIGNLSDAVSDVVTALMTTGNFGTATVVGVAANFDPADMPAIFALAKNYRKRNLLLDGSHLAGLIPQDTTKWVLGQQGAFGFDNIIMQNRWTGAATNSVGFVADPRAIGVAAGRSSEVPSRYYENMAYLQLENGPEIRQVTWFDPNTQVTYSCFDLMFGAAVGDGTAAECLVSA